MSIHETAIVDPAAEIAGDVEVGPYSVIGPRVTIGEGTIIGSHCRFDGTTEIGTNNRIGSFCAIGAAPQDLGYDGTETFLRLGDDNLLGDYVQLCRGTVKSHDRTTHIGNNNFIMAYCHVGHDCVMGNQITFSNGSMLGGHVEVGNNVVFGGNSGVHQFCAIGDYAMIAGGSVVVGHVTPYVRSNGPFGAGVIGLNTVGLQRSGVFEKDDLKMAKEIYRIFFREGGKLEECIDEIRDQFGGRPHADAFVAFVERMRTGDFKRRPIARAKS